MITSHEAINVSIKIRDRSHERRMRMVDRRNLEYQRFCRYFSLPYFGTRVRTETPVWIKCRSKKELARHAKNRERILNRSPHHYNEMSPYEEGVHTCMVFGELFTKNPELKTVALISKHQGLREALENQEVRTTLVNIGSIFVGTPGYNWDLGNTRSTPHPLSIVPINSEFHNAELAHIAIKSHRRSAYNLQRSRGKRRHIIIMIILHRFNPPPNLSNGVLPFSNPYGSLSEHHHFLDTMEEGEFTLNKYGKHYKIPANTSVVATANPINQEWKDTGKIDPNEIPTIKQNIQRFDIISVFRAPISKDGMGEYLRKKREVERKYDAGEFDDYIRFLRNYFKYVRSLPLPTINKDAEDMLDKYVCEMADRGITGIKRRRETSRRLIISRARLKLKNIADEDDAEEVMKFYNVMLMHEGKTIAVSKRPKIETYDACIEILKKNKSFQYSYIALMDTMRKDAKTSEQVKQYIGPGNLDIAHNRNVRDVLELLQQHRNIIQTRDRPITLQWVDDDTPKTDSGAPPTDIPSTDQPPVNPPPTDTTIGVIGKEQQARRIFDELASKNVEENPGTEKEVLESRFREALISTGKFSDIDLIIKNMENDGFVERIVTELGDILRKSG